MNNKADIKKILISHLIIVGSLLALMFIFKDIFHLFELKTLDVRYVLRDKLNKNPKINNSIININIDDYSIKQSGKITEWPKTYYATLINKLSNANPKIIVCDIIFGDSNDTLGNVDLIESINNSGIVVTPFLYSNILHANNNVDFMEASGIEFMPDFPSEIYSEKKKYLLFASMQDVVNYSSSIGFANIVPDPDGIVRRIPVLANFENKLSLSLFFQSLCDYLEYDPYQIEIISKREVKLPGFLIKDGSDNRTDLTLYLDKNGYLPINYSGRYNIENYPNSISAWDILSPNSEFSYDDKLIILSDVSVIKSDYKTTPLDGVMPGSYIYTNAASSILNQDLLIEWRLMRYSIYLIVLISTLIALGVFSTGKQFSLVSLSIILFHVIFNIISFVYWSQIVPMISGLVLLSSSFLFITFFRFVKTEKDKGVLEGSLSSLLSPSLMSKIKEDPSILKLGGERKRITVIFADLANFTTFCDKADPAETQEVLSDYFKMAADVIFSEGGIIDKYLGDGILAFFENEGDSISSPIKATHASIKLQREASKLNELYKSQNRFPFIIRIGMATGYAKVGNIGPPEKIDYTIIGSVVNLASRLQGFGTDNEITIDKDTYFFIKDEYKTKSCGENNLKGFDSPQEIFKIEYDK